MSDKRSFIIHLKAPDGGLVDYITTKMTASDLLEGYDMEVSFFESAGWSVQKAMDVRPSPQSIPEATTEPQVTFCKVCGKPMTYKEGVSTKTGKPWKGWFCETDKTHEPVWVK